MAGQPFEVAAVRRRTRKHHAGIANGVRRHQLPQHHRDRPSVCNRMVNRLQQKVLLRRGTEQCVTDERRLREVEPARAVGGKQFIHVGAGIRDYCHLHDDARVHHLHDPAVAQDRESGAQRLVSIHDGLQRTAQSRAVHGAGQLHDLLHDILIGPRIGKSRMEVDPFLQRSERENLFCLRQPVHIGLSERHQRVVGRCRAAEGCEPGHGLERVQPQPRKPVDIATQEDIRRPGQSGPQSWPTGRFLGYDVDRQRVTQRHGRIGSAVHRHREPVPLCNCSAPQIVEHHLGCCDATQLIRAAEVSQCSVPEACVRDASKLLLDALENHRQLTARFEIRSGCTDFECNREYRGEPSDGPCQVDVRSAVTANDVFVASVPFQVDRHRCGTAPLGQRNGQCGDQHFAHVGPECPWDTAQQPIGEFRRQGDRSRRGGAREVNCRVECPTPER